MIDVFILGYNGADYFTKWHSNLHFSDDIRFHFVDNGNQKLSKHIDDILIYRTTTNIFCAGGWNLICDLGFDYMNLDKIIIGQEDARFDETAIRKIYEKTDKDTICGGYSNNFHFSLFGLHKETFHKVGRFDENFLIVGDEDNDYKQRCKIKNVDITLPFNITGKKPIGIPSINNISITGEIRAPYIKRNGEYLHRKWGNHCSSQNKIYEYELPYNGEKSVFMTDDYREYFNLPNNSSIYMSSYEYDLFKKSMDLK